jgi:erythromycin esterase-like protein
MRAAVTAVRLRKAAQIAVAVPVGPVETCQEMNRLADDVVCLVTPEPFMGVGMWYADFTQTTDEDVRAALERAARRHDGVPAAPARRSQRQVADEIRKLALPLAGAGADYDPLLQAIGDARLVLIGEASHGTHEFYALRAELTRQLIESKGFHAVATEADWPDAYRVNRFVRGRSRDVEAVESLAGFERFPAWMWRNADVLDFVGWLKEHNDKVPATAAAAKVGFYGLDLYSLHGSIDAVVAFLERSDPEAALRARRRYSCFDHFRDDVQRYGLEAGLGLTKSCEDEAVEQLAELRQRAAERTASAPLEEEELFFAEQNARVVVNAEEYYRSMFRSRESSWNLRDSHMVETLDALMAFLDQRVGRSKVVVWAHNSHVGDARATEMGERGELNVGQLVRQKHGTDAVLVGFTTRSGTVTAASEWGGPAERKTVRPALAQSYEALFHEVGLPRFMLDLRASSAAVEELGRRRLERAIGVIYLPESERASHYFHADLPRQFDHLIHVDETRAVEPLERTTRWLRSELTEPFPTAG